MPDDSAQWPADGGPEGDGDPAASDAGTPEPSPLPAEEEPTRFRVADTGWPPPSGSVGPALPRRRPGTGTAPGGAGASGGNPADVPAAATGPASARSGWVTSPPLADEPWAGLAPAARAAEAVEDAAAAEPATPDEPAAADEPTAADEPPPVPADASDDQPVDEPAPVEGAARTPGRHRSPRGRRGRSRGRSPRRSDAAGAAPADVASTAEPAETPAAAPPPVPARGHGTRARARSTRPSTPGWPMVRLVLLGLAVVAALVLGVLTLLTRVWPGPAANPYTSASTRAAVAAATAVAPPILSYDYTTIDQKVAQLAPLQTTTCATQYRQLITSTVKPLAVQNKATQRAAVLAAGVTSATSKTVTVLAFMQLTSTNSVKTGKEINEAQISVSMVKQHGRWLLEGTSANGAGSGGPPSCGGANPAAK